MSGKEVLVDIDDRVAMITLNRPECANALTPSLLESLSSRLGELASGGGVGCAVLRGAGEKAFSVGMDLKRMSRMTPEESIGLMGEGGPLRLALLAIEELPIPVIAMIRGYAAGAALEVAIACDLRVASEGSMMGMPPARLGIIYPPDGMSRFLRCVGTASTRKLFLSGDYFDAQECSRMGLVDYVVEEEDLERFTLELAGRVAKRAPLSMAGHKKMIRFLVSAGEVPTGAKDEMAPDIERAAASHDAAEGIAAFMEKREPEFRGE